MEIFEYNFDLLRTTRESKKIEAHIIALDLCLSERHIKSLEENSLEYFASPTLKYAVLKKYITALDLNIDDIIFKPNQTISTSVSLNSQENDEG